MVIWEQRGERDEKSDSSTSRKGWKEFGEGERAARSRKIGRRRVGGSRRREEEEEEEHRVSTRVLARTSSRRVVGDEEDLRRLSRGDGMRGVGEGGGVEATTLTSSTRSATKETFDLMGSDAFVGTFFDPLRREPTWGFDDSSTVPREREGGGDATTTTSDSCLIFFVLTALFALFVRDFLDLVVGRMEMGAKVMGRVLGVVVRSTEGEEMGSMSRLSSSPRALVVSTTTASFPWTMLTASTIRELVVELTILMTGRGPREDEEGVASPWEEAEEEGGREE